MEKLLVILGPTASGKSALAMSLAKAAGAEIISADSMQIYRGIDIGTAKPTPEEQAAIKHHLIDVVDPDQTYSVARFVAAADEAIADATARHVPLIVTGGTPLYFKSLFYGLFDGPGADEAVREALSKLTGDEMHARLSTIDPASAERIHAGDRKRLIRALEVYNLTGKPISSMQKQWTEESNRLRHPAVWVGLKWEKDELNRRINARVGNMMELGWPLEVRKLLENRPKMSQNALSATGYGDLIQATRGEMDLDVAAERIKIATRQLARRQMKWLRRFSNVHWLAGDAPLSELTEKALELWKRGK